MKLFNVTAPYPDELLFSYFIRTLKANGLDISLFMRFVEGNTSAIDPIQLIDFRRCYMGFLKMLPIEEDAGVFYLSMSTYRFDSLFLTVEEQMAYINEVFREPDELNMSIKRLYKTVNICPICAQDDIRTFGEFYFHRTHQLSGICFCPKHHIRLQSFVGEKKNIETCCLEDFHPIEATIPDEDLIAYADYANALFKSDISSNLSELAGIIRRKLYESNYIGSTGMQLLLDNVEKWDHKALCATKVRSLYDGLSRIRTKKPSEILGLSMFLYPDPVDFVTQLENRKAIIEKYECNTCANSYYGTPYSHEIGWGCPECNKKLTNQERYNYLVQVVGDGEYDVKDSFISLGKRISHYHNACGKDLYIRPNMFLFYGERCKCRLGKTEKALRKTVEENGFELVSYDRSRKRMILFHPACRNSFEISIVAYKTSPQCRACEKQFIATVEDPTYVYNLKARAIAGDEYTVLSYANKKIKLRHNSCGFEFEAYTYNFFHGHRCPQCTAFPTYEELNRVLTAASSGKYILTDRNPEVFQSVVVLNTESGERERISNWFLLQELSRPTPSIRLPGIKTGYRFPGWDAHLQAYKEYREEYGKEPPKNMVYKGLALGAWCFNMKRYRTTGKLTEDRIQTMSDAGFVWGAKFNQS